MLILVEISFTPDGGRSGAPSWTFLLSFRACFRKVGFASVCSELQFHSASVSASIPHMQDFSTLNFRRSNTKISRNIARCHPRPPAPPPTPTSNSGARSTMPSTTPSPADPCSCISRRPVTPACHGKGKGQLCSRARRRNDYDRAVFAERPWFAPLLFDNGDSDARDHCAAERSTLPSLSLSQASPHASLLHTLLSSPVPVLSRPQPSSPGSA